MLPDLPNVAVAPESAFVGVYVEDALSFSLTEPAQERVRHVHPATGFDPQQLGAQCDRCPLRHPSRPPVGAEYPLDGCAPEFAIVGEAPGPTETQSGRPFDGASGKLLEQLGRPAGIRRDRAVVTNAVACMPPGTDFGTFEARFQLENSDRKREGRPALDHPLDCCRPRLEAETRGVRDVISMGARAMHALLPGGRKSLDSLRGGPLVLRRQEPGARWIVEGPDGPTGQIATWEERRLLPTVHPARLFPGREPRWTGPFIGDLAKAVRFFHDRLTWVDPPYSVNPRIEEIAAFLGVVWTGTHFEAPRHLARTLSYDFESDRREPLLANVRCLGIGTRQGSIVLAFLSRDGRTRFWAPEQEVVVKAIVRAWALGPGLKVGWNSVSYDSLLFWAWMGIVPHPQLDGMIVQKDLEPEMPHSLGYAGSVQTDIRAWKAGKEALDDDDVKDDSSLWRYNGAGDVPVTHQCTEIYAAEAVRRGLLRWGPDGGPDPGCIIGLDHEKARVCRTMHINGMLVDQPKRAELYAREQEKVDKHAGACRKLAEDPSLNINSNAQVARLLFSRRGWHLPYNPEYTTAAGLPSVSEPQTRWLLQQVFLGDQQRAWLMAYRRAKAAEKAKGTYLTRTAPVLEDEQRGQEAQRAENKAAIALRAARDLWPRAGRDLWVPFAGPAERAALSNVLYEDWGLEPVRTKGGRPSVSRDSLVTLWQRGLQDHPRRFLSAVLSYRRHVDEAKWLRKPPEGDEFDRCTIWEDGRVHAQWKATGAATGRLACTPNQMNQPKNFRKMYVPGLGHLFVSADSDQVEMRLIAVRWGLSRYLEAFALGLDPHQITMHLVWGDEIWTWEGAPKVRYYKDSDQAKRAGKNGNHGEWEIGGYFDTENRVLAKVLFYASAYNATLSTVYDIITSAMDKDGNLMFLHLTLDDVERMHVSLLKNCQEMQSGWAREIAHWKQHGFIVEPVAGRACWFLDGEDQSKMVNFPIQSAAAALIDKAMLAIDAKYPLRFGGPNTGLVAQVHDQLTLEVPAEIAPQVARDLQECMTGTSSAFPGIQFGAKASVKEAWA